MSNLMRWDPFREMLGLRRAMDRLFDDAISEAPEWEGMSWNLALDVIEGENEYQVKASIPGIKPEDLEITYNNNILTIKGETTEEKESEEKHYHLRERRHGSFSRSLTLPSNVKADEIKANYEQGVLTLFLPKAEEAKPKRIAIGTSNPQKVIEGKVSQK